MTRYAVFILMHVIYNALWAAATPLGRLYFACSKRNAALRARLAPVTPVFATAPIWIHACSVGEVAAARTLALALKRDLPEQALLFTTSTSTGHAQAERQLAPLGGLAWCPFDAPGAVRSFLRAAKPRMLVLIETEIWPNLLREAERAGIPVLLVNGRISERHFERYKKVSSLFHPAFARLTLAAMQDARYAERIQALGARADHVCITGNLKFDAVATNVDAHVRARLRAQHGIPGDAPVLVFGSTRPGDEARAASCWASLRGSIPGLHLVIAPRHLDRIEEALAPFGEAVLRRSALAKGGRFPNGERVHCIDTHGELTQFYALASAAVIGGSFSEDVQGHNPLEPAALGIPAVFGPCMKNFDEAARVLLDAQGAVQVSSQGELLAALQLLLSDAAERRHIGTRGRKAVLDHQGASERNVRLIKELL